MQRKQMRDVTVLVAYIVAILRPLLQLAPGTDLRLQQFLAKLCFHLAVGQLPGCNHGGARVGKDLLGRRKIKSVFARFLA